MFTYLKSYKYEYMYMQIHRHTNTYTQTLKRFTVLRQLLQKTPHAFHCLTETSHENKLLEVKT